jgi:hypothetical protein
MNSKRLMKPKPSSVMKTMDVAIEKYANAALTTPLLECSLSVVAKLRSEITIPAEPCPTRTACVI